MKPEMKETYRGMANNLYGTPDSERRKFFAVKNTSLFAMNLMVAAKGIGLETHPMDGFEHAFMIDYGLKRADYIEAFFKNVNWDTAESRIK